MSDFKLLIDDREHAVYDVIKNDSSWFERQRLYYGDFAIVCPNKRILALIERKTIYDYGASIRDGRHKNKEKLIEMRNKHKCDVYYIIEGNIDDVPLHCTFDGIPMSSIYSSIMNLSTRDGIFMHNTANQDTTAKRLYKLLLSYKKHHKCAGSCSTIIGGSDAGEVSKQDDTIAQNIGKQYGGKQLEDAHIDSKQLDTHIEGNQEEGVQTNRDAPYINPVDDITTHTPLSDDQIRANILLCIPYITTKVLPKLNKYSIKDLCIDHVLDNDTSILTKKTAERLHINDAGLFGKMMYQITGISKTTAKTIAETLTFADLNNKDKLATVVGKAMVQKIIKIMNCRVDTTID